MSANWYILHVLTGEEVKTKEFLESEIDRLGYKNEIVEIFVPSEEVVQMRNGKKVKKIRLFYPGYLFINCHLSKNGRTFSFKQFESTQFCRSKELTAGTIKEGS